MEFNAYLSLLMNRIDLNALQAEEFLGYILDESDINDQQVTDALKAITEKKPTVDEVYGFVMAMQSRMHSISAPSTTIDTCGTGGDKTGTFNISTAAAIVIASRGVPVAKHGNRAATSLCGSADVLQELGVPISLTAKEAESSLAMNKFVFLFAPQYHPSLKRLSIIRKSLGFPTVFNLLGPLLNPAHVKRQVIGTYGKENSILIASVMSRLGYEHGLVLTSSDGLDEASLDAEVSLLEVKGNTITEFKFTAMDFDLSPAPLSSLLGGDAIVNASIIESALEQGSKMNPHREIIILNAALGFYVAGETNTINEGVSIAKKTLESGKAAMLLSKIRIAK